MLSCKLEAGKEYDIFNDKGQTKKYKFIGMTERYEIYQALVFLAGENDYCSANPQIVVDHNNLTVKVNLKLEKTAWTIKELGIKGRLVK